MRRAAKVDTNQPEIVQALRDIGAVVFLIGIPLDLLVAFRGKLTLMEVKNPDNKGKVSKSQQVTIDLLKAVGVRVAIVRDGEEAIDAVS
ncbi:unnamed protein product [marine sediment metagenome]|uniref:VRR-NUC domain-containing protein n=1 Tax=marine sediment metagenome TaxID=412755 RepID=X0YDL5_9ZZZZ